MHARAFPGSFQTSHVPAFSCPLIWVTRRASVGWVGGEPTHTGVRGSLTGGQALQEHREGVLFLRFLE